MRVTSGGLGARRARGVERIRRADASTDRAPRPKRGGEETLRLVDRDGERLRSFGVSGQLRATRTAAAMPVEGTSFDDVDIDYYGNVYAVDREGNRVHKLRDDLYPLHTFGERGTDE